MMGRWSLVFVCAVVVCQVLVGGIGVGLAQDRAGDLPRLGPDDWPWWRGPLRNGVARAGSAPPTHWDESRNVAWKSPVPGRGHASPIVVAGRVLLATADEEAKAQSVVAFDQRTGRQLWQTQVSQGGFFEKNHPKNTEATSTLASDGELVFGVFVHHHTIEVIALDLAGRERWRRTAGPYRPKKYEFGYGPSPLLYKNWVIVASEYDGDSFIVALERTRGEEAWRTARPNNQSYTSPVVGRIGGRDLLLTSGNSQVTAYDPHDGKQVWSVEGSADATAGTPVWDGDLVFATGGYPQSDTVAVRSTGQGEAEVVWRNRQKCYEQSMLAHDGYVYSFTDSNVLYCWRAEDGKTMWTQRLKGPVSASGVLAGGHIYWSNELGTTFVFKATSEKFELVAENQLGDESFASPAVSGRQLFLRTAVTVDGKRQEHLYCLEAPAAAE